MLKLFSDQLLIYLIIKYYNLYNKKYIIIELTNTKVEEKLILYF